MRKKITWIIVLTIFIILFAFIIRPIRTMKVMESIAKSELMGEPFYLFTKKYERLYKDVEGPLVNDLQDRVQFTWYKVLEWGDTASISAYVYKNFIKEFLGVVRAKNPPSITADIKWYYVYVPEGISRFTDILPNQYDDKAVDISIFKLDNRQQNIVDSITFTIEPERLLLFLKKGHFQVVEKLEEYVAVDFYQPIAKLVHSPSNSTTSTMSAKVFFIDSLYVLIIPYDIPTEYRDRK